MSLADILKRSHKGLPSLVTTIDRQLSKSEPVYSARAVKAALANLNAVIDKGDSVAVRHAFNTLQKCMLAARTRDDHYMHISEVRYGCNRMFYYRITDAPKTNEKWKPDPKLRRTFDVGTFYHSYIQECLLDAGVLRQDEVRVFNKELNLLGHNDGEGVLEKTEFILEIKTINSYGYAQVLRNNSPKEDAKFQASIYAKERKIDNIFFLYINKDTSDMKEFLVNSTSREMRGFQSEAYEKINEVNNSVKSKKVPERFCKTPDDERALGCSYCNFCFKLK